MQVMKLNVYINITGAFIVIIASILMAFALCQKEKTALSILKTAANAYSEISSDIRTGYTSLPDAFLNVYEKSYDRTIKEYFKLLHKCITDEKYTDINTIVESCAERVFAEILITKDRELLEELGKLPVHLDVVMQVNYLDDLVTRIRRRISGYSETLTIKCRIYAAVCLCTGIMVVIILI